MLKPTINVAAGILLKPDQTVLITQRPAGKPWSGWWELPGGKIEDNESPYQALIRELKEELDIQVTHAVPWVNYSYEYPKTIVNLHFFRVYEWQGQVTGVENQQYQWHKILNILHEAEISTGLLLADKLLPATIDPLRWLQIPDQYLISNIERLDNLDAFMTKLKLSLESGVQLIQFREPKLKEQISHDQLFNIFKDVLSECHKYDAACLINSCHAQSWWAIADGIHFAAQDAISINFDAIREQRLPGSRRGNYFVAVSTHNLEQIQAAQEIGADFVVLGHVLNTTSHPNQKPIGWENFNKIRAQAKMPVFAIGGQSKETYSTALENGAHGIAAIRGLPIT